MDLITKFKNRVRRYFFSDHELEIFMVSKFNEFDNQSPMRFFKTSNSSNVYEEALSKTKLIKQEVIKHSEINPEDLVSQILEGFFNFDLYQEDYEIPEEVQYAVVSSQPFLLSKFKNPSELVKMKSVELDGNSIRFISNPSPELQMTAVSQDLSPFRYILHPTLEVQQFVISRSPNIIEYIENPTKEIQMLAVQQAPSVLELIKNQHPEVCLLALNKDKTTFIFVRIVDNKNLKTTISNLKKRLEVLLNLK